MSAPEQSSRGIQEGVTPPASHKNGSDFVEPTDLEDEYPVGTPSPATLVERRNQALQRYDNDEFLLSLPNDEQPSSSYYTTYLQSLRSFALTMRRTFHTTASSSIYETAGDADSVEKRMELVDWLTDMNNNAPQHGARVKMALVLSTVDGGKVHFAVAAIGSGANKDFLFLYADAHQPTFTIPAMEMLAGSIWHALRSREAEDSSTLWYGSGGLTRDDAYSSREFRFARETSDWLRRLVCHGDFAIEEGLEEGAVDPRLTGFLKVKIEEAQMEEEPSLVEKERVRAGEVQDTDDEATDEEG